MIAIMEFAKFDNLESEALEQRDRQDDQIGDFLRLLYEAQADLLSNRIKFTDAGGQHLQRVMQDHKEIVAEVRLSRSR